MSAVSISPIKPSAQNLAQWTLLGWFSGAIATFSVERLQGEQSLFTHFTESYLAPELMGGAVLLMSLNIYLALKAKKSIQESLTGKDVPWLTIIKQQKALFAVPFIVTTAVLLNLAQRMAPMVGVLAGTILRTVGGSLFGFIEGLFAYKHWMASRQHGHHMAEIKKQLAALETQPTSSLIDSTELPRTFTSQAYLQSHLGVDKQKEPLFKAVQSGFRRMKQAGFDMNQELPEKEWLEKALIAHQFDRTAHRIKAGMHVLIAGAMITAFALCPALGIAAIGAAILTPALFTTLGTLGARLMAALYPERKHLQRKLMAKTAVVVKSEEKGSKEEKAPLVSSA
jgi:hypothetical protein